MADCKTCKHKGTSTHICDECTTDYGNYEKKIVTNADKIRSMTDAELADFLYFIEAYCEDGEYNKYIEEVTLSDNMHDILDWLQSEAE